MDRSERLESLKEIGSTAVALFNVLRPTKSTKSVEEVGLYKSAGRTVIKSIDEERQLVTAMVLRPDEPDLHGDIYTALEVEKACHNFNVVCRKTNTQHKNTSNAEVVESYISPAEFELGEGIVKSGDWIMTMHVIDASEWEAVQKGDFTGFSIGCVAEVEEL